MVEKEKKLVAKKEEPKKEDITVTAEYHGFGQGDLKIKLSDGKTKQIVGGEILTVSPKDFLKLQAATSKSWTFKK